MRAPEVVLLRLLDPIEYSLRWRRAYVKVAFRYPQLPIMHCKALSHFILADVIESLSEDSRYEVEVVCCSWWMMTSYLYSWNGTSIKVTLSNHLQANAPLVGEGGRY